MDINFFAKVYTEKDAAGLVLQCIDTPENVGTDKRQTTQGSNSFVILSIF